MTRLRPARAHLGLAAAAVAISAAAVAFGAATAPAIEEEGERTAGAATVFATGHNAFSFPAANLTDPERTRFAIGNSFFRRNWVEAPASTSKRDGLGPHFIARSCGGCHVQDGRGAPPELPRTKGAAHDPSVALLLRLSLPGTGEHGGPRADPVYGDQLANAAIPGVRPEGRVEIRWTNVAGRFADGTRYVLRAPSYAIRDPGYGPFARDLMIGPRIAPQLIGAGLLESVPDAEIERNAREQAAAGGPIAGKVNRVYDAFTGEDRIGRFGWKANVATLAHQAGSAFLGDMGITSAKFPRETCTPAQADCLAAPSGNGGHGVEVDDETFGNVVFYTATLAPPARRGVDDPKVRRGGALFAEAQCATCHRPSYVTAAGPIPAFTSPALAGQRIWPYTDLLLHDMGPALADGRPDFLASGRQWKTPPLWGNGLVFDVNGHRRLIHDGRANGALEAILWHGGEAEASKAQVIRMSKADREALVRFVESL